MIYEIRGLRHKNRAPSVHGAWLRRVAERGADCDVVAGGYKIVDLVARVSHEKRRYLSLRGRDICSLRAQRTSIGVNLPFSATPELMPHHFSSSASSLSSRACTPCWPLWVSKPLCETLTTATPALLAITRAAALNALPS